MYPSRGFTVFDGVYPPPSRLVLLLLNSVRLDYGSCALAVTPPTDLPHFSQCLANIYCKLNTYLNYQIKNLFMMWGGVPLPTDEGVGFIYTRSVHAQTMSLTECVFDASLPNSNSAVALCPCHPSTPSTTSQVFNTCEMATHQYVLAPTPPLQSQPTATPPHAPILSTTTCPCRQQPDMSCGGHRGGVAH